MSSFFSKLIVKKVIHLDLCINETHVCNGANQLDSDQLFRKRNLNVLTKSNIPTKVNMCIHVLKLHTYKRKFTSNICFLNIFL